MRPSYGGEEREHENHCVRLLGEAGRCKLYQSKTSYIILPTIVTLRVGLQTLLLVIARNTDWFKKWMLSRVGGVNALCMFINFSSNANASAT